MVVSFQTHPVIQVFDYVCFVIGEAFSALRRNVAIALASVTTGAIALFLLGLLTFACQAASDYASNVPNMFDMRVFLVDHTNQAGVEKTILTIRELAGVSGVTLIPKEKAWEKMRAEQPELTKNLQNPLPDQLKVVVTDLRRGDRIAREIQSLPTVLPDDGVHYLREEQRVAIAVLDAFKILGPALFLLLVATTGILIYNTIRLTVISRKLEIRIMQLVGAPTATIRVPFLIEGTVQGIGAGLLAALLLYVAMRLLAQQLGVEALPPTYPLVAAMSLMVFTGGAYGFLCSTLAVRIPPESH